MNSNLQIFSDITVLSNEMRVIDQSVKQKTFDTSLSFCNAFSKIYDQEKLKLPYHINLLDILWANENAHSRIFAELIKQKNDNKYEILQAFIDYLRELNSTITFKVTNPRITAEKARIDVLIIDKDYALIIENKIHNATDQESQIARYIVKAMSFGYKKSNIYVVYLTKDGIKKPPKETWILNGNDFRQEFRPRFLEISYKNDILPWLKESLLPNCRNKDIFLKSTLEQYIDYFEGLFNKRKIQEHMNNELKKHIEQTLNLTSSPEENISILESKLKDVCTVEQQLQSIIDENRKDCWLKWTKKLNEDFPDYELIDKSKLSQFAKVGIRLSYKNISFSALIEQGRDLYFGLGRHYGSETLEPEIKEFAKPIIYDYKESPYWYGWKYVSFEEAYEKLKGLIYEVEKEIKNKA
jgi:hypothetical protein